MQVMLAVFWENDAALEFEKFNNSGTIKGNGGLVVLLDIIMEEQ